MEGYTMFKNQKPQYYNDVNSPQIENTLSVIPVKILEIFLFFFGNWWTDCKIFVEIEWQRIYKVGEINYMLPDIKTYDKAVLIKIVWSWFKGSQIDQWIV